MMMLVPIVAAAAATLGLTVSSVKNMAQTYHISSQSPQNTDSFSWTAPVTAQEAVSRLESMKRKELLELFLSCKAPSTVSEIQGEWNGSLLENNGRVLVRMKVLHGYCSLFVNAHTALITHSTYIHYNTTRRPSQDS